MSINLLYSMGWDNCVHLANDHAEVLVPLDIGPRILSYKVPGGINALRTFAETLGRGNEPQFVQRGGHRLWVSPEDARSYEPDNTEIDFAQHGQFSFSVEKSSPVPWHVRKKLTVTLAETSSALQIDHLITNEEKTPITIAAWALTVMATGGLAIIPQPPLGEHGQGKPGQEFLPDRVMVPWPFTDLSDDRWSLGRHFIIHQPKAGRPAAKLGLSNKERWAAYMLPGTLFLKTFEYLQPAVYPDLGCNFEIFSQDNFVELESLSPLKRLEPGQSVGHRENWHLFGGITPPDSLNESELQEWLAPFLSKIGL